MNRKCWVWKNYTITSSIPHWIVANVWRNFFMVINYIFIITTTGDFYPGYLCSLSPWERWFLLRWIFQVILQYFVVKLEFTFQLYLICNEGWIIDERDSQITKKWATTLLYNYTPPPVPGVTGWPNNIATTTTILW